jgi:DNA adenine methylase
MAYPGGKGRCYQHIINLLPPHSTYIETHLGGGAVLLHKKPAKVSIAVDKDPSVIERWRRRFPLLATYVEADAVDFLVAWQFAGQEVVYCDPPYLPSTRRRRRIYLHDYTEHDHVRLLETLRRLPCHVVLSGYPSELYDELLRDWNTSIFQAKTHDGVRREVLWFNFAHPNCLHDVGHLGRDFRERQTIKRRLQRIRCRIALLSPQEKHSLAEWLRDHLQNCSADRATLLRPEEDCFVMRGRH